MQVAQEGNKGYVYNGRFTGAVLLEMLQEAQRDGEADVARVHSEQGACTKWHSHPGGQVLLLLSGIGRVGNDEATHEGLEPGTHVITEPHELHWHGAQDEQDATWLTITYGITEWTEDSPPA